MPKKILDEQIISALVNAGSVRKAAEALDIQPKTISNRLQREDFRQMYAAARSEMLKESTVHLQKFSVLAVKTLADVAKDDEASPTARVAAAAHILNFAARYTEITDILERLEALEAAAGDAL